LNISTVKSKSHPLAWREDTEGPRNITSVLGGVGGQRQVPDSLFPGMTQQPESRRLDGPKCRSGKVRLHQNSIPAPSSP